MRCLLHSALFIELLLICETFLSSYSAKSDIFSLSDFLKSFVLRVDIVITCETATFERCENRQLVKCKGRFFEAVTVL